MVLATWRLQAILRKDSALEAPCAEETALQKSAISQARCFFPLLVKDLLEGRLA